MQEEFPDHNGFEEGKDYVLITGVGEGAFGECFMAVELPYYKEREFCVKKVWFCWFRTQRLLCPAKRLRLLTTRPRDHNTIYNEN